MGMRGFELYYKYFMSYRTDRNNFMIRMVNTKSEEKEKLVLWECQKLAQSEALGLLYLEEKNPLFVLSLISVCPVFTWQKISKRLRKGSGHKASTFWAPTYNVYVNGSIQSTETAWQKLGQFLPT